MGQELERGFGVHAGLVPWVGIPAPGLTAGVVGASIINAKGWAPEGCPSASPLCAGQLDGGCGLNALKMGPSRRGKGETLTPSLFLLW